MKIIFITRTYPPIVGGMEKVSYEITTRISKLVPSYIIANRKGRKNLPFFLPYAFLKGLFLIVTKSVNVVHLSDAMLSPLGLALKYLTGRKVVTTVHALDVTHRNPLYQFIIPRCLKRLDKIISISDYTIEECVKRGVPREKCVFIPNGVNPDEFILNERNIREKLSKEIKVDLKKKKVLLSVGHLVKRKGFNWFIENVMCNLDKDVIYIIIGGYGNASKGDELQRYQELINRLELQNRVFLLGKTSDRILKLAYNSADLFIMPNIKVPGDAEGFGIVAIEASSIGLPVIASNLEGLKDAIKNGENGYLIEFNNANAFIKKVNELLRKNKLIGGLRKKAKEFTRKNYSWNKISRKYLMEFK